MEALCIVGGNYKKKIHLMLIWAPLIPVTRWSCSQQSLVSVEGSTAAPPSSWDKGCQDKHHIGNV